MAVSRKGKRPIVIGAREFLWWIALDDDFCGDALRVVSPDGVFHVKIPCGQINLKRSLAYITSEPSGYVPSGRFHCPVFETAPVTPHSVRKLIEWVLNPATVWLPVDYDGNEI